MMKDERTVLVLATGEDWRVCFPVKNRLRKMIGEYVFRLKIGYGR
jgi:hypothetical protein